MANELLIRNECIRRLNAAGFTAWPVDTKGIKVAGRWAKNPNKGMPDICGFISYYGIIFMVETKDPSNRENKKHKAEQDVWIDRINNGGGIAFRCNDPDKVVLMLAGEFKKRLAGSDDTY